MTQKTHGPARGQAAALSETNQTTAAMTAQTNPNACLIEHSDGSTTYVKIPNEIEGGNHD